MVCYRPRLAAWLAAGGFLAGAAALPAQIVLLDDHFDAPAPVNDFCGQVLGWETVPGKVNGYSLTPITPSSCGHKKNHTGDPQAGGSAFEPDNNPGAFASYYQFDPQSGIVRVSAWVWDDVESRKDHTANSPFGFWIAQAPIRGMVGLTAEPGLPGNEGSPYQIPPYDDYAFIGVEAIVPNSFANKPDPNAAGFDPYDPAWVNQFVYRWWTKSDGWNLTLDPETGKPVPRRVDFRYAANGAELTPQTWRFVEIEVRPYSGQIGDIRFFIDGKLVGEGRRQEGANHAGYDFRRAQIGTRFPTQDDIAPTYSYEHFWFDDLAITASAAPPVCANAQLRFDADDDGDVDQVDFAAFQACYTGNMLPGVYDWAHCRCMNTDADEDIDEADLAAFNQCASGPAVPAEAGCDDTLPPP